MKFNQILLRKCFILYYIRLSRSRDCKAYTDLQTLWVCSVETWSKHPKYSQNVLDV